MRARQTARPRNRCAGAHEHIEVLRRRRALFVADPFSAGPFVADYFAAGDFALGVFAAGHFAAGAFAAGTFAFSLYALGFFVVAKHRKTLSGKP